MLLVAGTSPNRDNNVVSASPSKVCGKNSLPPFNLVLIEMSLFSLLTRLSFVTYP